MFEQEARNELHQIQVDNSPPMTKVRRCLAIARKAEHVAANLTETAYRFYGRGNRALMRRYSKAATKMVQLAKSARDQARSTLGDRKPSLGFGYDSRQAYPDWNMASISKPWRPSEPKKP